MNGASKQSVAEIIAAVSMRFNTFGGERKSDPFNPITVWAEGQPATFALGVSVEDVVRFVIEESQRRA